MAYKLQENVYSIIIQKTEAIVCAFCFSQVLANVVKFCMQVNKNAYKLQVPG